MHLDNPRNHIVVGNLHLIGAPSQIGPGRETKTKSVNNMPCGISLQHQTPDFCLEYQVSECIIYLIFIYISMILMA